MGTSKIKKLFKILIHSLFHKSNECISDRLEYRDGIGKVFYSFKCKCGVYTNCQEEWYRSGDYDSNIWVTLDDYFFKEISRKLMVKELMK